MGSVDWNPTHGALFTGQWGPSPFGNPNAPLNPDGTVKGQPDVAHGGTPVVQQTVSMDNEGYGVGVPQVITPKPTAPSISPKPIAPMPLALNSEAAGRNTGPEDALRNSYLNSLKPNYGFTFAGQNSPSQFSSVPGAKK